MLGRRQNCETRAAGGSLLSIAGLAMLVMVAGCAQPADPTRRQPGKPPPAKQNAPDEAKKPLTGAELYARHCAACHGDKGNGQGVAAAFLFPKPRNFRQGRFKLVSSASLVPTADDLDRVLLRGMPGSSMPPWPKLTPEERALVAAQVTEFFKAGLRDQYLAQLKDLDEEPEEEVVAAFVKRRSTPEPAAELPAPTDPTQEAIARGKDVYVKQGCVSCHGKEGKGDGVKAIFDDDKLPTRPRDFTAGVFKGEHDFNSLYRRVLLGMPGTPMASSGNLTPEQISDLTHFVRSLSDEKARQAVILGRATIVARPVSKVPQTLDDAAWTSARPVTVRTTPLWWRDEPEPDLQAAAIYDATSVAVRLIWNDSEPNRHAGKTESFRDAAAMELSAGGAEPFLGMGAKDAALELWLWDADRARPADLEEVNPRIVVDVYPFNEKQGDTAEFDRPGAKTPNQVEVSLPAKAAGNQLTRAAAHASGGSTLTAGGPGTVTFRPRENQSVTALGEWRDGKWTVVLWRPLKSPEGVPLAPGSKVSAAFALWDGEHQDRGAQKRISIWQDLVLEGG